MRTKAERRQYIKTKKEKVKKILKNRYQGKELLNNEKFIGKLVQTIKPCSCYMCGNPRKHLKDKKTIQEKIHDEKYKNHLCDT